MWALLSRSSCSGICLVLCIVVVCHCTKELRILGLQPMTGDAWPGGSQCLLAVEMAIEKINKHPDILKGYELIYDYIDHEVRNQ